MHISGLVLGTIGSCWVGSWYHRFLQKYWNCTDDKKLVHRYRYFTEQFLNKTRMKCIYNA